jgi:site-specific recombinase XerD
MKTNRGLCPLYLRITAGNSRAEVSLNKWINPLKWNAQAQELVGNSPEAKAINMFIKSVEVRLHNIHTDLLNRGEIINANLLKAHLQGKAKQQKTVLEAFDYHLKLKNNEYSPATVKKYQYCKEHLKNFIWTQYCSADVAISKVDLIFIKEFQLFLYEKKQFIDVNKKTVIKSANEHNSALKYVKMFKTVIKNAVAYKWLDADPFALFNERFKTEEQESLDEIELKKITEKELPIERLDIVRNLFVFACFTGLSYADLKKLSKHDIVIGIDNSKWINLKRTKTNITCKIPLLKAAEDIIDKYSSHPLCQKTENLLPVYSNQKLNEYLKEIAALSGITKNLTCHVARRTFATIASNSGVPAETIVKVIGHSSFKYLHLYAKTGERKIASDMNFLRQHFG